MKYSTFLAVLVIEKCSFMSRSILQNYEYYTCCISLENECVIAKTTIFTLEW